MPTNDILFYQTGQPFDIFSNVTNIGFQIQIANGLCNPNSSEAVFQAIKCLSNGARTPQEQHMALGLIGWPGLTPLIGQFNVDGRSIATSANGEAGAWIQRMAGQLPGFNHTFLHSNYTGSSYNVNNYLNHQDPLQQQFINITVKEQLMYEILLCKFTQHPELLKALLDTYPRKIIENTSLAPYNDPFWGNGQSGAGRNALGYALERVRTDLIRERDVPNGPGIKIRTCFTDELTNQLRLPSTTPSPPSYITTTSLQQIKPCTTVDEFNKTQLPKVHPPQPQPHPEPQNLPKATIDFYFDNNNVSSNSPMRMILSKLQQKNINCTGFKVSVNTGEEEQKTRSPYVVKFRFSSQEEADNFCQQMSLHSTPKSIPPNFVVIVEEQQAQQIFKNIDAEFYGRTHPHKMLDAIKHHLDIQTKTTKVAAKDRPITIDHSPDIAPNPAIITKKKPPTEQKPTKTAPPLKSHHPAKLNLTNIHADFNKLDSQTMNAHFIENIPQEATYIPTATTSGFIGHFKSTNPETKDQILANVKKDSIECPLLEGQETVIPAQQEIFKQFLIFHSKQAEEENRNKPTSTEITIEAGNFSPQELKDFLTILKQQPAIPFVKLQLPDIAQCTYGNPKTKYTSQQYEDATNLINEYNTPTASIIPTTRRLHR